NMEETLAGSFDGIELVEENNVFQITYSLLTNKLKKLSAPKGQTINSIIFLLNKNINWSNNNVEQIILYDSGAIKSILPPFQEYLRGQIFNFDFTDFEIEYAKFYKSKKIKMIRTSQNNP